MNWADLCNATSSELIDWAEKQSWARAMSDCPQDADWHAEGDVWTHTKMVLAEVEKLEEWKDLSPREQKILQFTALLHDAAKPLTTQVDPVTGRTTSPKHAVKGEHLARGVLRALGCDLPLREEIARMVRYHGRPAFLLDRSQPAHEVVRMSWYASNKLLHLFAVADTRERATAHTTRPEENVHFWKMLSEEQGCFDQPYAFGNDHARFLFFRKPEPNLHYVPHENYSCTVTLLSGLPGSGKDRWLSQHRLDTPVVSLDDLRDDLGIDPTENQGKVIQAAQERCRELLRSKTSFAFNATDVVRQTRQRWTQLFADYHARIQLVYIEPPLATILSQNATRADRVPEEVIRRLADKTDVPTWAECHELKILDDLVAS